MTIDEQRRIGCQPLRDQSWELGDGGSNPSRCAIVCSGVSLSRRSQPANDEWTHFGYTIKVAVDMHDAHSVVERGLGDEEVRDGRAVPHAVVVRQVLLESERSVEDVGRR